MADFWKLRLTQDQYKILRKAKGNKIVFIFNFPSVAGGNWFSLAAYPMKGNNVDFEAPEFLGDDSVGISAASYLLGNLFVKVKDLKKLIEDSTTSGEFDYLLFTPKQDQYYVGHINYDITVVPSTTAAVKSLALNPSPPHGST